MRIIRLITILFLVSACTSLHFRNSGQTEVPLGKKEGHSDEDSIEGERNYFLWGFVPRNHVVYVDREITDKGYYSGANVEVGEYQSYLNFFFSVISFGMWIPKNYRINFHGYRRHVEID